MEFVEFCFGFQIMVDSGDHFIDLSVFAGNYWTEWKMEWNASYNFLQCNIIVGGYNSISSDDHMPSKSIIGEKIQFYQSLSCPLQTGWAEFDELDQPRVSAVIQ